MNHRGAQLIEREDLALIEAPPPTRTWKPLKHSLVLDAVEGTVLSAGYQIKRQELSVSHEGHRFFGVMDLASTILDGITLAVGFRSSTDKTFPIGMCCGSRVFCCDNLSFTSEIVISKKHTTFGEQRYREGIASAVASLGQYQAAQGQWINRLRSQNLTREEADSLILRSYEDELIGARTLPQVIEEWRRPSYEEFKEPTAWSLWNCYTTVLGKVLSQRPAEAALTTIKLQRLFSPEVVDGSINEAVAV
jgi:hypothetical protein